MIRRERSVCTLPPNASIFERREEVGRRREFILLSTLDVCKFLWAWDSDSLRIGSLAAALSLEHGAGGACVRACAEQVEYGVAEGRSSATWMTDAALIWTSPAPSQFERAFDVLSRVLQYKIAGVVYCVLV